MGVPFEALIPYAIMVGMFSITGAGLATTKLISNHGKRPRWNMDVWDRQMTQRDYRLTGVFRQQTDAVEAPVGFEVSSRWKLEDRVSHNRSVTVMDSVYGSTVEHGLSYDAADSLLSPSVGDSLASRKASALSTKLATVLSSSYADSEIREALTLLDLRQAVASENIKHNLKAGVQKEVIDANARILDDFGHVAEQLKHVGVLIETLNKTCDEMKTHILAAKQESAPVLDEASTLLARKQETELRQHLLDAFRKQFVLSAHDLNILTNIGLPLDEDFFTSLGRAKAIQADCQILLAYDNQRLGSELMEQTTQNLDAAFKKLYTWIQGQFQGLDLEDPHTSASIRRALRILSERPTLFASCLDFFAEARQLTLSNDFQAALTGAAQGQAIEFSTHDPVRYIGDMLAWVHSAAVSEKEALEGLFISGPDDLAKGLDIGLTAEPWARITPSSPSSTGHTDQAAEAASFDGHKALNDLISRNIARVSQTLYSRVQVAVSNASDAVLVYKIYNLLTFYHDIFVKLFSRSSSTSSSSSTIQKTILQLESLTLSHFEQLLEDELSSSIPTPTPLPPADLTAPPYLLTSLQAFADICKTRGPQMTQPELERVFSAMLIPVLDSCAQGTKLLQQSAGDPTRSRVYTLNYLLALRSTLRQLTTLVPAVSIPLAKVNNEIDAVPIQIEDILVQLFLGQSGVTQTVQELDASSNNGNGKNNTKTATAALRNHLLSSARTLDDFLSSGLLDAQDRLKHVSSKTIASAIIATAVERFCADFEALEQRIVALDHAPAAVSPFRDIYPRSVAEIRALLS
ncbi:hypothetical protein DV735_g5275, partial [Chaetothyriales sp. CBS 134920]